MSAPLVIGIDYRPALSRATGVGRYFQGLVSGLQRIDREDRYVLFTSSFKERPAPESRPPNFQVVDRRVPVRVLNALWHHFEHPSLDWLAGCDINVGHSPTPLLLPTRRARSIVTVHDLFFLDHPQATAREIQRDYASLARDHVRRADAVVAVSSTTADEIAARLDVARERIHVIHPGVDDRILTLGPAQAGSGAPYLLAVATEDPRKDLTTLLEAFAMLKKRGFEGRLAIAGGTGLDTPRILDAIRRLSLEGDVSRLGYVDAGALPALYRDARALVSPSLWEGFGLPLLEAMATGTVLVASDIPAHREVSEGAAIFVAPGDPVALARGIEAVWTDETLRSRLKARGRERAREFSWTVCAQKTRDLYRRIA